MLPVTKVSSSVVESPVVRTELLYAEEILLNGVSLSGGRRNLFSADAEAASVSEISSLVQAQGVILSVLQEQLEFQQKLAEKQYSAMVTLQAQVNRQEELLMNQQKQIGKLMAER